MKDLNRLYDHSQVSRYYNEPINNTFYCPYCGQWKDNEEIAYKEEVIRSSFDYPWYLPNHVRITTYKKDMPICSTCLSIFTDAGTKATHISLIVIAILLSIEAFLCFLTESGGAFFGLLILKVPLFFILKYVIRYVLVKKKGIKYHVRKYW